MKVVCPNCEKSYSINTNLFKFEIINDDQRLNTPAVRLKKQYPVSCSIKYIFFEAEPKAEVGDKGTIKFSLERPATETEKHMRWTTFVKFEVVSSEDDDCEPLCVIA